MNKKHLNKDNSVSLHYNNIHALAIELYKIANDIAPKTTSEVCKPRDTLYYNLGYTTQFSTDPIHSVYNGTESASYFGPKIPAKIKNKDSLDGFKS